MRLSPAKRSRMLQLDGCLHRWYRAPERLLGNRSDPLEEAVYIILTFQTDIPRAIETWRRLRRGFPTWEQLARARAAEVEAMIAPAGLHKQKSAIIRKLLLQTKSVYGVFSLDEIGALDDVAAERQLSLLPGLSWKGARCVLLYAFGRDRFPIDSNTFRILKRIGVVPRSARYRTQRLHDVLEKAVPPRHRRRFHVNLVVHGRRTCVPRKPACGDCKARSFCATGSRRLRVARSRA